MDTTPEKAPSPDKDTLKHALKAFRKKIKVLRLDDESNLGGRGMSAGRKSPIVAITPPNQFPHEVWEELVRQGKLKRAGGGTYELVEE